MRPLMRTTVPSPDLQRPPGSAGQRGDSGAEVRGSIGSAAERTRQAVEHDIRGKTIVDGVDRLVERAP